MTEKEKKGVGGAGKMMMEIMSFFNIISYWDDGSV